MVGVYRVNADVMAEMVKTDAELRAERDALRAALAEALEIADDEAQYMPEYLLHKFGYPEDLARLHAVLDRDKST